MPAASTVIGWKHEKKEFYEQYARARESGYELMADALVEIADDKLGDPARDRLRVDTRKWMLSKALPKIYGDRQTHEVELSANGRLLALIEAGMGRAGER
jgi:hypothetical protein